MVTTTEFLKKLRGKRNRAIGDGLGETDEKVLIIKETKGNGMDNWRSKCDIAIQRPIK